MLKKSISFGHCPNYLSPPSRQFGQVVQLFLDVKNDVFVHITEPSNNDYDNDVSDNCDNNFGTFDDFGVKNDQQVSHNMILMSKYKEQYGGKKGKKFGQGSPYFLTGVFPYAYSVAKMSKIAITRFGGQVGLPKCNGGQVR